MDQVPKILKPLVDEWTHGGYIVSFKVLQNTLLDKPLLTLTLIQLETDQNLILPKARQAIERYGHQVVIGNDLHRRKFEVVFVSKKSTPQISESTLLGDQFEEQWLRIPQSVVDQTTPGFPVKEIEEDIVQELIKRHTLWVKQGQQYGRRMYGTLLFYHDSQSMSAQ